MFLLSGTGTLRLILILLILWLLMRAWVKSRTAGGKPPGTHWTTPEHRPKGEVRIERPETVKRAQQGPVEDADFEEIK